MSCSVRFAPMENANLIQNSIFLAIANPVATGFAASTSMALETAAWCAQLERPVSVPVGRIVP